MTNLKATSSLLNLKAPTVLLMGPPGSGKTTSLVTLLSAGIEVFDIITEPNGLDAILDAIRRAPNSEELMSRFHWHVVSARAAGWNALRKAAKDIGSMSFKDLKFMKPEKTADVMIELQDTCKDFTCARTGAHFGDVSTWDDKRALVIDSLSGVNEICRTLVVGFKPSPDVGEWGVMVGQEYNFIYQLLFECDCFFVVTAHINRTADEITGATQITPAAMTYPFSGKIGKDFSEVILAHRIKDKFSWSTSETNADVKNRALPISDSLPPDFATIISTHRARVESITSAQSMPASPAL